jgi:hypothetical protein
MLVTVGNYWWLYEAYIAHSLLSAEGIPSWLQDENVVRVDWLYANAVRGVRLQVPADRVADARAILAEGPAAFDDQGQAERCTTCGSRRWELVRRGTRAPFLTWLILGVPLWRRRSSWRCAQCGTAEP